MAKKQLKLNMSDGTSIVSSPFNMATTDSPIDDFVSVYSYDSTSKAGILQTTKTDLEIVADKSYYFMIARVGYGFNLGDLIRVTPGTLSKVEGYTNRYNFTLAQHLQINKPIYLHQLLLRGGDTSKVVRCSFYYMEKNLLLLRLWRHG